MQKRFIGFLFLLCVAGFASVSVQAQTNPWPELLGPAQDDFFKVTPGGIMYDAQGFDRGAGFKVSGKRKMRQKYLDVFTPNFLQAQGVAQHIIDTVYENDRALAYSSTQGDASFNYMPNVIDQGYAGIEQLWENCGDVQVAGSSKHITYREAIRSFPKNNLRITAAATPIQVSLYGQTVWAAGAVLDQNDNLFHVSATVMTVDKVITDPAHAFTQLFADEVKNEIGNSVGNWAGIKPTSEAGEVGLNSPCAPRATWVHSRILHDKPGVQQ